MAYDAFLKIDGVDGEATRAGYEKWIQVNSFSWGAHNNVSLGPGKGGASTGRVNISAFELTKPTDVSSPILFQHCCNGKHFPKAKIVLNKSTGDTKGLDYLMYEFTEVYVERLEWGGQGRGDELPEEKLGFVFGQVQVSYTPQTAKGTPGSPVRTSWNLLKNTP